MPPDYQALAYTRALDAWARSIPKRPSGSPVPTGRPKPPPRPSVPRRPSR
jgi:hypothetical protein